MALDTVEDKQALLRRLSSSQKPAAPTRVALQTSQLINNRNASNSSGGCKSKSKVTGIQGLVRGL